MAPLSNCKQNVNRMHASLWDYIKRKNPTPLPVFAATKIYKAFVGKLGHKTIVCGLRSAVCGLRSAVCGLRSPVCSLQMSDERNFFRKGRYRCSTGTDVCSTMRFQITRGQNRGKGMQSDWLWLRLNRRLRQTCWVFFVSWEMVSYSRAV